MPRRDVDEVFAKDEFAELYDLFNAWAACDDYFLTRARASGGPVLDIGCGTGLLAAAIAATGLAVVGADPAEGMLRVARARPGGGRVTWVHAAGQDLDLGRRFAFVYMTGHAFQALLTDADAVAVLRAAARHLTPDGRFVFETRNPAVRAWENWASERPPQVAVHPDHGRVEQTQSATYDPATGIVHLVERSRLLDRGDERIGRSRLRFIDRDHLAGLIAQAGLRPVAWHGDWDGRDFAPDSREIIAVAAPA
jgi:SAM-dependent methyltransferase